MTIGGDERAHFGAERLVFGSVGQVHAFLPIVAIYFLTVSVGALRGKCKLAWARVALLWSPAISKEPMP